MVVGEVGGANNGLYAAAEGCVCPGEEGLQARSVACSEKVVEATSVYACAEKGDLHLGIRNTAETRTHFFLVW